LRRGELRVDEQGRARLALAHEVGRRQLPVGIALRLRAAAPLAAARAGRALLELAGPEQAREVVEGLGVGDRRADQLGAVGC